MDESDANRKRIRDKIRNKRNQRLGTNDAEDPEHSASDVKSMLQIQDPATRMALSRKVEAELRKVFGSDPDAMRVAQDFIDNPMSTIDAHARTLIQMSTEEKRAAEDLVKMSEEEEEEEAPPLQ